MTCVTAVFAAKNNGVKEYTVFDGGVEEEKEERKS